MTFLKALLLLTVLFLAGCNRAQNESGTEQLPKSVPDSVSKSAVPRESEKTFQQVSLNQADPSQSMAEAMNRKILRNGDLKLEVSAPADAQRKITSIAESLGGFVVTSESKQRDTGDPAKQQLEVTLVVRVPALQFGPAMDQIRGTCDRVIQEKTTGQDVTEEFIDLEARIKTQKALEL